MSRCPTPSATGGFSVPLLATLHLISIVASNDLVQWPAELFGVLTTWCAFTIALVFVARIALASFVAYVAGLRRRLPPRQRRLHG